MLSSVEHEKSFITSGSVLYNSVSWDFPFQNNSKNLSPSYERDLDFLDCFERGRKPVLLPNIYV